MLQKGWKSPNLGNSLMLRWTSQAQIASVTAKGTDDWSPRGKVPKYLPSQPFWLTRQVYLLSFLMLTSAKPLDFCNRLHRPFDTFVAQFRRRRQAMADHIPFTNAAGAPVADNTNILTAGPRGPALLQDVWLMEKLRISTVR
jgi:hypothetical protein